MKIWQTLLDALQDYGTCAVATIADVKGSSPRGVGSRMLIYPTGAIRGTIGGGTLEWHILAKAQAMLSHPDEQAQLMTFHLGPDLGQCCGGTVQVLIEVWARSSIPQCRRFADIEAVTSFTTHGELGPNGVERIVIDNFELKNDPVSLIRDTTIIEAFGQPRQQVVIFGAGHTGKALIFALSSLNFDVIWVDPRREAFPEMLPANVNAICPDNVVSILGTIEQNASLLVMTHSHTLDFDIIYAALSKPQAGYIGLIGSKTKKARFTKRLTEWGLNVDQINTMTCPIGLPGIKNKEPAAIAASVVADLLMRVEAQSSKNASWDLASSQSHSELRQEL